MKPSSTNRQLLGLSGIRGGPTASPELRLGWMQATHHPSPLGEEGEDFFLDIPSYRAHFVSYFAKIGAKPEGRSDQTITVVAAFALDLLWR
jgi:hypothetical protein